MKKLNKFNEDFVPATLDEAINYLYSILSDDNIEYIKENKPNDLHFTYGVYLRNSWSLWEKDTIFKNDIMRRFNLFGHADDCSGLILCGVWAKVKGLNINQELEKTSDEYKKHWLKHCVDPKTGEDIKGCKDED